MRVLGIGDAPYELLEDNLKQNLQEYYKVSSLENYDEVYKACAFLRSATAGSIGSSPTTNTG